VQPRLKRRLVIGAAGAAVAAGAAGAAYGVTQSSRDSERQAFLNDAAKRLNVSPDKLSAALKGAFSDRLDAAVKAGRLTQQQADAIKQRLAQKGGLPFFGGGPDRFHGGPLFFGGFGGGPLFGGLDAAAKYLGMSDQQLGEQLRSGKSLAQVAKDKGKSVDGLKAAIKDAVKSRLDQAVNDKRITKDEEDRILSKLDSRLDDIVNRTPGKHRWGARPAGPPPGRPPLIF
jgi:hypothetical protein